MVLLFLPTALKRPASFEYGIELKKFLPEFRHERERNLSAGNMSEDGFRHQR